MKRNENSSGSISNLKISNEILAKFLVGEKLVLASDILIETTKDISSSILITEPFHRNKKSIILAGIDPSKIFSSKLTKNEEDTGQINFVCNGVSANTKKFVDSVLNHGAFNIGICTSSDKEYTKNNRFLQRFRGDLLAVGIPVDEYQETVSDYKLYLLSYRDKTGKRKWKIL